MPTISFIIPVRDDADRLARCLKSIAANKFPAVRVEIVVVDNGSRDGSADVARALGARVVKSAAPSVSTLRNIGAREARGTILAFVDADHEVGAGWIRAAIDVLAQADVGAAGDLYHGVPRGTWVQRAYDGLRSRVAARRNTEWLGGGNLAVRRDVFEETGGFDTSLTACEDVDFCRRLRARGYRLVRDPALFSMHWGDPATPGMLFRSELWRGRDNLRVSLRALSWRSLPGVSIPVVDLICFAVVVVGLATLRKTGLAAALAATVIVLAFALARAVRMTANASDGRRAGIASAFVVALVYDAARALALILRRGHHRARARGAVRAGDNG